MNPPCKCGHPHRAHDRNGQCWCLPENIREREPGCGCTSWEPERVEWNPNGDHWQSATVTEHRSATHLVIRLDDNRQELLVEKHHCRPAPSPQNSEDRDG